jgi:hypothetical protein
MQFWPFSGNSEEQDMENLLFTCFTVLEKNILKKAFLFLSPPPK